MYLTVLFFMPYWHVAGMEKAFASDTMSPAELEADASIASWSHFCSHTPSRS